MRRLIVLFLLVNFIISCSSDRTPGGIMKQKQMTDLLVDIHLADGYLMQLNTDSANKVAPSLYGTVFKKHGTDSLRFVNSLKYYSEKPDILDTIYKQVSSRIDKMQSEEQKREEEKRRKEAAIIARKDSIERVRKADSLKKAIGIDTAGRTRRPLLRPFIRDMRLK
ncbi:DUF4296 domain-containing protein [Pedobacter sp. BS3]|nr:DUF4296 domain-containing protein [Pedobacter sp. BS3]